MTLQGSWGPPLPAQIIGVVPDFPDGFDSRRVAAIRLFRRSASGAAAAREDRCAGRRTRERLLRIDRLWTRFGDARPIHVASRARTSRNGTAPSRSRGRYSRCLRGSRCFLACLGLFGLAAFATERRTREVGIRKALGAGRADIAGYFLWLFMKPVLWSAVVAVPVTRYLVRRWLDGFAYRVELDAYTLRGRSGHYVAHRLCDGARARGARSARAAGGGAEV